MSGVQNLEVGGYLAELMQLVLRATPGPLVVSRAADGGYAVASANGSRPVATFVRQADAELFARALPGLRAETAAVIEALGQHHDDGTGVCAQDGQAVPCTTRRIVITQLLPRAAVL